MQLNVVVALADTIKNQQYLLRSSEQNTLRAPALSKKLFARLHPHVARQLYFDCLESVHLKGISAERTHLSKRRTVRYGLNYWHISEQEKYQNKLNLIEFLPLEISYHCNEGVKTVYVSYNGGSPQQRYQGNRDNFSNISNPITRELFDVIELHRSILKCIENCDPEPVPQASSSTTKVNVKACPSVLNANALEVQPVSVEDWELLQMPQNSSILEQSGFLSQITIVYPNQILPIYLGDLSSEVVYVKVLESNFDIDFQKGHASQNEITSVDSDSEDSILDYLNSDTDENVLADYLDTKVENNTIPCLRLIQDTKVLIQPIPRPPLAHEMSSPLRILPTRCSLISSSQNDDDRNSGKRKYFNKVEEEDWMMSQTEKVYDKLLSSEAWHSLSTRLPSSSRLPNCFPACVKVHPKTFTDHIPGSELYATSPPSKNFGVGSSDTHVLAWLLRGDSTICPEVKDGNSSRDEGDDNSETRIELVVVEVTLCESIPQGHIAINPLQCHQLSVVPLYDHIYLQLLSKSQRVRYCTSTAEKFYYRPEVISLKPIKFVPLFKSETKHEKVDGFLNTTDNTNNESKHEKDGRIVDMDSNIENPSISSSFKTSLVDLLRTISCYGDSDGKSMKHEQMVLTNGMFLHIPSVERERKDTVFRVTFVSNVDDTSDYEDEIDHYPRFLYAHELYDSLLQCRISIKEEQGYHIQPLSEMYHDLFPFPNNPGKNSYQDRMSIFGLEKSIMKCLSHLNSTSTLDLREYSHENDNTQILVIGSKGVGKSHCLHVMRMIQQFVFHQPTLVLDCSTFKKRQGMTLEETLDSITTLFQRCMHLLLLQSPSSCCVNIVLDHLDDVCPSIFHGAENESQNNDESDDGDDANNSSMQYPDQNDNTNKGREYTLEERTQIKLIADHICGLQNALLDILDGEAYTHDGAITGDGKSNGMDWLSRVSFLYTCQSRRTLSPNSNSHGNIASEGLEPDLCESFFSSSINSFSHILKLPSHSSPSVSSSNVRANVFGYLVASTISTGPSFFLKTMTPFSSTQQEERHGAGRKWEEFLFGTRSEKDNNEPSMFGTLTVGFRMCDLYAVVNRLSQLMYLHSLGRRRTYDCINNDEDLVIAIIHDIQLIISNYVTISDRQNHLHGGNKGQSLVSYEQDIFSEYDKIETDENIVSHNSSSNSRPTRVSSQNHTKNSAEKYLYESILHPITFQKIYERSPIQLPSGVLLYGPSGCGKTWLLENSFPEEIVSILTVQGPELLDRYIGMSEYKIRQIFQKARQMSKQRKKPTIIIFENIDSLCPGRGSDHTGVTDRIVNQLLTLLDGVESKTKDDQDVYYSDDDENDDKCYQEEKKEQNHKNEASKTSNMIYIVATTSRPNSIDPALLRPGRLEKHIWVGYPCNATELKQLVTSVSSKYPLDFNQHKNHSWMMGNGRKIDKLLSASDIQAIFERAYILAIRESIISEDESEETLRKLIQQQRTSNNRPDVRITQYQLQQTLETLRPSLSLKDYKDSIESYYRHFLSQDDLKNVENSFHLFFDQFQKVGKNVKRTTIDASFKEESKSGNNDSDSSSSSSSSWDQLSSYSSGSNSRDKTKAPSLKTALH